MLKKINIFIGASLALMVLTFNESTLAKASEILIEEEMVIVDEIEEYSLKKTIEHLDGRVEFFNEDGELEATFIPDGYSDSTMVEKFLPKNSLYNSRIWFSINWTVAGTKTSNGSTEFQMLPNGTLEFDISWSGTHRTGVGYRDNNTGSFARRYFNTSPAKGKIVFESTVKSASFSITNTSNTAATYKGQFQFLNHLK